MTYLLIVLVLAIIISPMLWLRQTPRQKLVTAMRQQAARAGIQVKLARPADAREGEGRLEYVRYSLPWLPKTASSPLPRMEKWMLVHQTRRGDPSPWGDWQWLGREANPVINDAIGAALQGLPPSVSALEASAAGLSIYWQERGELADIEAITSQLTALREVLRPSAGRSEKSIN
ncbi:hypothetical protein [Porticoccus sp.]